MRAAAVALLLLLAAPALTGCFEPTLEVTHRVRAGETLRVTDLLQVEKTLEVEPGGTLLVEGGRLHIGQGLLVSGDVLLRNATLTFDDNLLLHPVLVQQGSLRAWGSTLANAQTVRVSQAALNWTGGALGLTRLEVATNGRVHLAGARLDLAPQDGDALTVGPGGRLQVEDAALPRPTDRGGRLHVMRDGHARLVNVTLDPRQVSSDGLTEVGWHLLVHARTPAGQAVPDLPVEVLSPAAGGSVESRGVTDAQGDARLVAIEYALDKGIVKPHNPHALRSPQRYATGGALAVQGNQEATLLVAP